MKIKKHKFFSACQIQQIDAAPVCDPGVSITEPDQAMSIQQILDRVSKGLTTGLSDLPPGSFDDDDDNDFDDPTLQPGFDKLDMLQLSTSSQVEDDLDKIAKYKSRRQRKEREDAIEAEVQKRLKEQKHEDHLNQ